MRVGTVEIESFIASLLNNVPDFKFKDINIFIETDEQAFGEYTVEANVLSTGKIYKKTYAGRLVADDGKIKLLREALDTISAEEAFKKSIVVLINRLIEGVHGLRHCK